MDTGKNELQSTLSQVLGKYKIAVNEPNLNRLVTFITMLKDANKLINLTSITDDSDIIYKHILDSVLPVDIIGEKVLDIGCGGGFPSVPLAILNQNAKILAIDSVGKKVDFVNSVIGALDIQNLQAVKARVEELARKENYRESFDIVTSRAVAPLRVILEYSAPMLKNGGKIIAYKGSGYLDELNEAENALKILDCTLSSVLKYDIPEIEANRYILVITKNSTISKTYPRNQNKPRLKPL